MARRPLAAVACAALATLEAGQGFPGAYARQENLSQRQRANEKAYFTQSRWMRYSNVMVIATREAPTKAMPRAAKMVAR